MKKLLAMRIFTMLTICCLVLSAFIVSSLINAETITKFKSGETAITATMPGPVGMEILLPSDANVTTAELDVSTVDYGDKYPRNPELRLTDIAEPIVWAYKDVGYGDLGHQCYFNNSVSNKEILYQPSAIDRTTGILLPKGATVKSARLNITGIEYDYWEPGVTQLNPPDWGQNPPSDMDPHLIVWNGKLICMYRSYNWDVTNQTDGDMVINYTSDGVNWLPEPLEISKSPDTELPYLGGVRCGDYHPAAIVDHNNKLWVTWGAESDYTDEILYGNDNGITDGNDRDIVIRNINNIDNPTTGWIEITHPTKNAKEDTYSNNNDTYLWAKDDRRAQIVEFNNQLWVAWAANNTGSETFKGDRIGDIMVSHSDTGADGTWSEGVNLCAGDPWDKVDYWPQLAVLPGSTPKLFCMWVTDNPAISNGTDWDVVYRYHNGVSWSSTYEVTPIDDGSWSDDDCKMAVYNGKLYAIWRTRNDAIAQGPDFDIVMRSTSDGTTWGDISEVGYIWNGAFDNKPYAIEFDNELYVLWRTEMGGEGDFFVRSYHDGEFTEQQQLNIRKGNGDNYYITAAEFGNKLYAAWVTEDDELTEDDDQDVVIRSMTPSNLPLLIKLDIGAKGEYDYNNMLSSIPVTLDITSRLNTLLSQSSDSLPAGVIEYSDDYGNVMRNINLQLEITGPGKVKFDGLDIVYDCTLRTQNFNEHVNEFLKNKQNTADENGDITVPLTLVGDIDSKLKLSNLDITFGIKPSITLLTPPADNTAKVENNQYDINWTDYDPDDDAEIALYYDLDNKGYDGILIAENLSEDVYDFYHWTFNKTKFLEEGMSANAKYYIYAIISDGKDMMRVYSPGYVHIIATDPYPPSITLTYPKYTDELAWKSYEIRWTDDDGDSNAKITLWFNTLPLGADWIQIDIDKDGDVDNDDFIYEDSDGDDDIYEWDISAFKEGHKYKVRAKINDSDFDPFEFDSPGNILITKIPEPMNLSVKAGIKLADGRYQTHDQNPQLEWEKPDISLELKYYGQLWDGTANTSTALFDFDTEELTYPVSAQLEYGKTYYVELYAESLLGARSRSTSMIFDVVNNPPDPPKITFSDTTPYASDSLTCLIENGSVDPDDELFDITSNIVYTYRWYKNGELQAEYNDIANIPSDATTKNEVWKCVITPSDGINTGTAAEIEIMILNSAPSIALTAPQNGTDAKTTDSVLFSGSITDNDLDLIRYRITSDRDGDLRPEMDYTGGFFILSKKLSKGTHIITIWASDGEEQTTRQITLDITYKEENEEELDAVIIGVSIVIIVIIIIIIVMLLLRRKKRHGGEEIPPAIAAYPKEESAEGSTGTEGSEAFDEYGEFKKEEESSAPEAGPGTEEAKK